MPRTARLVIPNYPHHVIQRGHNRENERFKQEIEQRLGRRIEIRRRGRPTKQSHKEVAA